MSDIPDDEGWISFDDRLPDRFPCKGRNYNIMVQDVIIGLDMENKAFKHPAGICKSLPRNMSMPFTHWKPIDE